MFAQGSDLSRQYIGKCPQITEFVSNNKHLKFLLSLLEFINCSSIMNPPEIIRFAEFITISFKLKFPNLFDGMTNDDGIR